MNQKTLIKKEVDYEAIVKKGQSIYEKIKDQYEPKEIGKVLLIEVESGDVFLANDAGKARKKAEKFYPNKIFYLVRIGFTTAEAVAKANSRIPTTHHDFGNFHR